MSSLANEYLSLQRGCKRYKEPMVGADEGSDWGNCDFWESFLSSWQLVLVQYCCLEWHDSLMSENHPSTRLPCCCPMLLPGVWSCVFVSVLCFCHDSVHTLCLCFCPSTFMSACVIDLPQFMQFCVCLYVVLVCLPLSCAFALCVCVFVFISACVMCFSCLGTDPFIII